LREAAGAGELERLCAPWVRLPEALRAPGATGHFGRERTFRLFLAQVLSPDGSCREAVSKFLAWQAVIHGPAASSNTAGYCKARARLPLEALEEAQEAVAAGLETQAGPADLWYGRRVKVADGSSLSMPDTTENQALYPQPPSQKPGCGFPVMRIAALFSLATGALLGLARGALAIGEQALFRTLWDRLAPGDVVLTDRGFCSFAHLALLTRRGVDAVMRKSSQRTKGFHRLKRLGRRDELVAWHRPSLRPAWLSPDPWRQLPDLLTLREVSFVVDVPGFRSERITVDTTLLDPKTYPAQAFADLYRRRWLVELFLRDIKLALGMDILRCKSPHMVHRELALRAIAYNLVRALMLQAARAHAVPLARISFKATVQALRQWAPLLAASHSAESDHRFLVARLLHCIASSPLPHRPNRAEPRARKRRPKNYPLLTQPRHQFQDIPHRNKYHVCSQG
jgi:hypothetical protein